MDSTTVRMVRGQEEAVPEQPITDSGYSIGPHRWSKKDSYMPLDGSLTHGTPLEGGPCFVPCFVYSIEAVATRAHVAAGDDRDTLRSFHTHNTLRIR